MGNVLFTAVVVTAAVAATVVADAVAPILREEATGAPNSYGFFFDLFTEEISVNRVFLSPNTPPPVNTLSIRDGDSIGVLTKSFCDKYKLPVHRCDQITDDIFFDYYKKLTYTPTRQTSTLEDFKATRKTVLEYLIRKYAYSRFLEVGAGVNEIFSFVRGMVTDVVGTHGTTSNVFFKTNRKAFDLIFIDSIHEANQLYRDIKSSLSWLSPGGTIVIQDCNPRGHRNVSTYPPPPEVIKWTGDLWKAIVAYRMNPNVEVVVVDLDQGIGVIRKRQNKHPLPIEWQVFLGVNPISMLRYEHLANYKEELLPLVSLREFKDWLEGEEVEALVY